MSRLPHLGALSDDLGSILKAAAMRNVLANEIGRQIKSSYED